MRTSKKKSSDEDDPFAFLEEEEKEASRQEEAPPAPSKPRRGMPSELPILVARDISWTGDGEKSRSLDWWLYWSFPLCPAGLKTSPEDRAAKVLKEVLSERIGKKVVSLTTFMEYVANHRTPSLEWQAACWNEMVRRLGYEVPSRSCRDPGVK